VAVGGSVCGVSMVRGKIKKKKKRQRNAIMAKKGIALCSITEKPPQK